MIYTTFSIVRYIADIWKGKREWLMYVHNKNKCVVQHGDLVYHAMAEIKKSTIPNFWASFGCSFHNVIGKDDFMKPDNPGE